MRDCPLRRLAVGVLVVAAIARAAGAQDTPITSVRVTVAATSMGTAAVVQNLRDSPLLAWQIETTRGIILVANYIGVLLPTPGFGPLAPHEARTVPLAWVRGTDVREARITATVFADGYYGGEAMPLRYFLRVRQERSERLAFWLDAFDKLPGGTEQEKVDYLMAKVEAAGRRPGSDNVCADLGRRLAGRQSLPVSSIVEDYRRKVEAAYRETTPPLVFAPQGAPPSVTLTIVRSDRANYVVSVENLRDGAAVEALMLGYERPGQGGKLQPLPAYDACSLDHAGDSRPDSFGRVLPGHTRKFDIFLRLPYTNPRIDVAMVLFDDLSFEGVARLRDQMLAQRTRLAEDYRYWAAVYREAAATSPTEVRPLLERRRRERQEQNAALRAGADGWLGSEAISMFDVAPRTFSKWLAGRALELEETRARLTRHLKE